MNFKGMGPGENPRWFWQNKIRIDTPQSQQQSQRKSSLYDAAAWGM
jgi:hypothetical protein